jgi:hypothetical protein
MKTPYNIFAVILVLLASAIGTTVFAEHSWGGYHWARTANPFTLTLGDNLSPSWDQYLTTSASDWSSSTVLDLAIVPSFKGKTCKPTLGRVEVCNSTYGRNGWLGIASIWASGSHITQGTTKMNDTYFNMSTYNTPAWKSLVLCQELGHTFGLDHQDEIFTNANLGTCMDYTNDPSTNQHPNQHDYDMLDTLYAHLDTSTTVSATVTTKANFNSEDPKEWGEEIRRSKNGRTSLHERDLGDGNKVFTFVTWADGAQHSAHD